MVPVLPRARRPADRLKVSTDASISSPRDLLARVRACVADGFELADVLPVVTTNTARVLKLEGKGRVAASADADLVVLEARSLELVEVVAGGERPVRDGAAAADDPVLEGTPASRPPAPRGGAADAVLLSHVVWPGPALLDAPV